MNLSKDEFDSDIVVRIAFASDQNYFCGLLVTAVSMAEYANRGVTLDFTILDGGIDDASWDTFQATVYSAHPNSRFCRVKIDDRQFANFPSLRNLQSKMTYARLLLPNILSYSRFVIYCDVDFLWRADVAELWMSRAACWAMQCPKDLKRNLGGDAVEELERKWFEGKSLPFSARSYVCVGISIMNLELMRVENSTKKFFDFLARHPDVNFHDQTTLNAIFYGRIGFLDPKWQQFSVEANSSTIRNPCVIHYAADTPWSVFGLWCLGFADVRLLWFKCYAKIKGISTWRASRSFYSWYTIVFRRFVYLLTVWPIVREVYFAFLKMSGRGAYIKTLKRYKRIF